MKNLFLTKTRWLVTIILLTALGSGNVWGANNVPAPAGTYNLVTNASTLAAGDVIIITGTAASGTGYAISTTQNTNNRGQASVTISNNSITIPANNTTVQGITLEAGTTSGTLSFKVGDNGYLYAASSSNNYLKTESTKSANSSWTISISSNNATVTAQGSYTRKLMRHNSGSSIFACYATNTSTGTAVRIFKKETGSTKTLSYDANGANGGTVPTDATAYNVNDGAVVKTNSGNLWRVGHTFDDWSRNADGSGKSYANPDTFKIGNSGNKLYAKWENTYANSEFTLVEDLNELSAGSKIIIVGTDAAGTSFYAMDTTQTGNTYRGRVASGAADGFSLSNNNKTITLGASTKVQVITLEDLATPVGNTYQFNVESGYLYASGGNSNNNLQTQTTNNANGHWLIGLENGVFSIVAQNNLSRNVMYHNNGSTRFSCYAAGTQNMLPVKIYVKEDGAKYTITWNNGGHGTAPTSPTSASKVVLPSMSADGWQFDGWKANKAVTEVSTSSSIPAGELITSGTRVQLGDATTFTGQWKQICATPTFSVVAGTYNETQSVEIECSTPDGVTIYYTTNGSEPTTSSTEYTGAISITQTTTLKAIAHKTGCVDSEVATITYTLKCANITFDVAAGTYTGKQTVALSSTDGATIHYTTDGSNPTDASPTYSTPITVTCNENIKAIAIKSGWSNSNQGSATYHIQYNVTWLVSGNPWAPTGEGKQKGTAKVTCGSKVTQLPTDPDPEDDGCGQAFVGWTTAPIDGTQGSAPSPLFNSAEYSPDIDSNTTFHAVFADYTTD